MSFHKIITDAIDDSVDYVTGRGGGSNIVSDLSGGNVVGRILGGMLGFAVGGPLGGIAGAYLLGGADGKSPRKGQPIPDSKLGKTPPPSLSQQDIERARTQAREFERRNLVRKGRRSTILTGGAGVFDPPDIQRKTLLGQ